MFADTHAKTTPKGYLFPGYEQRLNTGSAIDPNVRGVCLDADPFAFAATDCPLPRQ